MPLRLPFSRRRASPTGGRSAAVLDPGGIEPRPLPGPGRPADPAPPTPPPTPPPTVASPGAGLVVGSAELRQAPVDVPASYSPERRIDHETVRAAFDLVRDRADRLVRMFYAELFHALGDEALAMFPASMSAQRDEFGRALVQWVATDEPEAMAAHLDQLGADHRKYDVEPRHYEVAGGALVSAWKTLAGDAWTPEHEAAVVASYTRLSSMMLDAAMQHRDEPASWGATVVDHRRPGRDFAIVRLQPDAPYPYRPGQYLTVELGIRPRLWRRMSIASAPRPDNTIDLHVRVAGLTGVSAALVMHSAVGDRVRLGPPRGNNLVVEPGTARRGLLCVTAGTGSAPVSAVVESMLARPDCPPVYAYVAARTPRDTWAADELARLVRAAGRDDRIEVAPVVAGDAPPAPVPRPPYTGLRGRIEQVVPPLRDWAALGVEVLVAGPDPMVASTVLGLTDRGVPVERIHFDQYDLGDG